MTSIHDMFDHIVADPFYSDHYGGMVEVDEESRVWVDRRHSDNIDREHDGDIIEILFWEWAKYEE